MIMTIDQSQIPKKLETPKRMLEIKKLPDGRDLIEINFSSLSVINDCLRKAQYSLLRKLRSNVEAEALTFGKGIHKGLEHWYTLPKEQRQLTKDEADRADTLIASPIQAGEREHKTALDSLNAFVTATESIKWLGAEDKRSVTSGIKILKAYFKHYADDGLEVFRDPEGNPYIEREVEFKMYEDDQKVIIFHGTIDIILRNTISGQLFIADHKTTAALGAPFYNRIKPNHQYTGYIWAAREVLGINTDSFLVNGIQVAKTKCEFARQPTQRTQEDFDELKIAVVTAVEDLLQAIKLDRFPMNAPNACTTYGTCQYYEVCSTPKALRETVIRAKYEEPS